MSVSETPSSVEYRQADKLKKRYLHLVLSRYPVKLTSASASVQEKIERFSFIFEQRAALNIVGARRTIIPLITEFIEMTDEDNELQSYLAHQEHEKLLNLDILFVSPSGFLYESPHVAAVALLDEGRIIYMLKEPDRTSLKIIHEESYQEALERFENTQPASSALLSPTPISTEALQANRFSKKYAREMPSKYPIKAERETNIVPDKIEEFAFTFSQQNALGVDGARRIIVPLVEEFIEMLSEDREIQPYLAHHEYPELLRLKVRFFDGDSGLTQRAPHISFAVFDKGEGIKYLVFDPSEGPDYQTVYKETYQEALKRLGEAKTTGDEGGSASE